MADTIIQDKHVSIVHGDLVDDKFSKTGFVVVVVVVQMTIIRK